MVIGQTDLRIYGYYEDKLWITEIAVCASAMICHVYELSVSGLFI